MSSSTVATSGTFYESLKSALSVGKAEYRRSRVLHRAERLYSFIQSSDAAGQSYLDADARWDDASLSSARSSRAWARRKYQRLWTKVRDELRQSRDDGWRGWSTDDRARADKIMQSELQSLIDIGKGMTPFSIASETVKTPTVTVTEVTTKSQVPTEKTSTATESTPSEPATDTATQASKAGDTTTKTDS